MTIDCGLLAILEAKGGKGEVPAATEEARPAHLSGQIPAVLGEIGPTPLATDPDIQQVDMVAVK